jgi:hypothetical protein
MSAPDLLLIFPEPLRAVTRACETYCVAGCCGTGAFVVSAAAMAPWVASEGGAQAKAALAQLDEILEVLRIHDGTVSTLPDDFNAWWPTGAEAVAYFETWRRELARATRGTASGDDAPGRHGRGV